MLHKIIIYILTLALIAVPTTVSAAVNSPMGKQMAMADNIQDQIDELQERMEKAQSRHESTKANRLYAEQQKLFRLLPGGSDPAVGEGGRTA